MAACDQYPCLSPNVVSLETDISDFAGAVSSNIMAIVGASQKGRTDAPVFVSSKNQFFKQFGRAAASSPAAGGFPTYGAYNALNYLEFGNQLWFQRIDVSGIPAAVGYAPIPSSVDYDKATKTFTVNYSATDLFKFTARGEGQWGGSLYVEVAIPKGQFDQRQTFTGETDFTFSVRIWEFTVDSQGVCTPTLLEAFNNLKFSSCDALLEASQFVSLGILSSATAPATTPVWFTAGTLQGLIDNESADQTNELLLTVPMGWEYTDEELSPLNATDFFPSLTASVAGPYTVTNGVNDIIALDVQQADGTIVLVAIAGSGYIDLAGGTSSVSDIAAEINAGTVTHGIVANTDSEGRLFLAADDVTFGTGAVVRLASLTTSSDVFGWFGFTGTFWTNITPDLNNCFDIDSDGQVARICGVFLTNEITDVDGLDGGTSLNTTLAAPVYPGTLLISWVDSIDGPQNATDTDNGDGTGSLTGDATGTITYETGIISGSATTGAGVIVADGIAIGADARYVFDSATVETTASASDLRFILVDDTLVADFEVSLSVADDKSADLASIEINAVMAAEQMYASRQVSSGALSGIDTSGDSSISFEVYDTSLVNSPTVVAVTLTSGASVSPSTVISDINTGSGGMLTASFDFNLGEIIVVPASGSGYNKIRVTDGTVTSGALFPSNDFASAHFSAIIKDAAGVIGSGNSNTLCISAIEAGANKVATILEPAANSAVTLLGFVAGQSDTGADPSIILQNQVDSFLGTYGSSVSVGGEVGCRFFFGFNIGDIQLAGNNFDNVAATVCTTGYTKLSDAQVAEAVCSVVDSSAPLGDPEQIIYNILMIPGNMGLTGTLAEAVIACGCTLANCRQDYLFIADMDPGLAVQAAVDFRNDHMDSSSYCATAYSWLKIFDVDAECGLLVPPSFGLAQIIPFNDNVSEPWFAPAGLNRGRAFKVLSLEVRTSLGDRDYLYANQINPFVEFPGEGVVLWGQKTLQKRNSALNRINVRRLLNYAKQVCANVARNFMFEPNDDTSRRRYKDSVQPFLDDIKNRRGLIEFYIDVGPSVNTPEVIERSEMCARIYLKPTKAIECICNDFTVVRQDATLPG